MSYKQLRARAMNFEIIAAKTDLQKKVGRRLDPEMFARADAALTALSSQFLDWLHHQLTELESARVEIHENGFSTETARNLYTQAHDLKGLGGTFGFPIITRMAGSLCRYLDHKSSPDPLMSLIDAHVGAINAVVHGDARDDTHPTARSLALELERLVAKVARGGIINPNSDAPPNY